MEIADGTIPRVAQVTFACHDCGTLIRLPQTRCGHVADCPRCGSFVDVPQAAGPSGPPLADGVTFGLGDGGERGHGGLGVRSPRQLWVEVVAVLFLAYLPYLYFGIYAFIWPHPLAGSFPGHMVLLAIDSLQVAMPLLLIMALSGDPWYSFGIVRPSWLGDTMGGCAIYLCASTLQLFVVSLLPASLLERPAHWVAEPGIGWLFFTVAACAINGFSEELVVRGYLLVRLEYLFKSTWLAIFVTAALFASYHLYQGIAGAIGSFALGLLFAIFFCLFRRLWPLCVAHALHNLIVYYTR